MYAVQSTPNQSGPQIIIEPDFGPFPTPFAAGYLRNRGFSLEKALEILL